MNAVSEPGQFETMAGHSLPEAGSLETVLTLPQ